MNTYVTGSTIRLLREAKGLTQAELARQLLVSAKTVSKWETAKGLPDISLLEPLAAALGVSVLELMQGEPVVNRNRAANLLRSKLYVCPLCGNVLHSTGQAVVSCCGITLPALDIADADDADEKHQLTIERVEDELFVTLHHPMEKSHFISFIAYLTGDKLPARQALPRGRSQLPVPAAGHWSALFLLQPPRPDESPRPPHGHPPHSAPEDPSAGAGRA